MPNRRQLLAALSGAVSATTLAPALLAAKPRLRPALCAYSFRKDLQAKTMTYQDVIQFSADHDLDGVDLTVYWFPSTEDSFLMPLRRAAYLANVEIYSISIRTDMCKAPGEAMEKELGEVRKWVDVAAKLGAGHIRVFGGNVPKGVTEDVAAGWVVQLLSRAADYAAARGVVLGLENHHGITEQASRIVEIVKRVNSPYAAINLDTANFRTKIYEQIEVLAPHAANVQVKVEVKDENGVAPSDWDRVAKMLVANKYRGYLALEYEAAEEPKVAIPGHLAKLRALCAKYSA